MTQLFDPETETMENWCVSADNQPSATFPNLRVWFDKTTGKLKKAEILPELPVLAAMVIAFPASEITLQPGEHYAGVIVGKDGEPDYHLILLPGEAEDVTWQAAMDWAASIGGKLRDECVEIVVLIFRANTARAKAPHLEALIERLQVAELLLRLSRDKRLISTGQYAKAVELTTNIGRQAGGWRRSAMSPAS